jgi:hypothetical protein
MTSFAPAEPPSTTRRARVLRFFVSRPPARSLPAPSPRVAEDAAGASAPVEGYGRFVAAMLGSCALLLTAVFAFNYAVDPYALAHTGLVPTAVESDRAIKLDLIEDLRSPPGIVILGSSRGRQAEPAHLRRLTGRSGFNAAVTSGTAADAYVMARFVDERFAGTRRRYVWFVDVGIATDGVNPQLVVEPRAAPFLRELDERPSSFGLRDVPTYLGHGATAASVRVVRACVVQPCEERVRYNADGSLRGASTRYLPERARSLKRSVDKLVAGVRRNPPRAVTPNPRRYRHFERAVRYMNSRGAAPVIVLNPIHPRVLAELRRHGFPGRKAALDYLGALRARGMRVVVVDGQDVARWGGTARDWTNATHINRLNMRRLLAYVARVARGELR